jgi:hypothetical protein
MTIDDLLKEYNKQERANRTKKATTSKSDDNKWLMGCMIVVIIIFYVLVGVFMYQSNNTTPYNDTPAPNNYHSEKSRYEIEEEQMKEGRMKNGGKSFYTPPTLTVDDEYFVGDGD